MGLLPMVCILCAQDALHNFLVGFSSIAANFAGVPLAFAFVATLGVTGFVTVAIQKLFHVNIYDLGFSIYEFWGLVIVYTYFQLPLMILVTLPALSCSTSRVARGRNQSRRFEFYLLATSWTSHLATLAHCSHNVTFRQLIRSLCHRICIGSGKYQPGANLDQFCC